MLSFAFDPPIRKVESLIHAAEWFLNKLADYCHVDEYEYLPDVKIVCVQACKLRKKLGNVLFK